jgi:hypothetical protein
MKRGNLIVAFILEGFGIWVIIDSYRMGLKSFSDPGPGLFPFYLGILLCLLSFPICINSLREYRKANVVKQEKGSEFKKGLKSGLTTKS